MQQIQKIKHNGFNVVSTFSGTGGSCLGYRMAGYKVLWANEFIPAAQESYKANHPNSILDTRNIRDVQPEQILEAIGLRQGEIDILDGSPPCSQFSIAGKREESWGKVKSYSDSEQRVDDLFFEYARILEGLKPKVFVAENVSGLIKGTAKGYFLEILQRLKDCGYQVECQLLDAKWLGVPQSRKRTIFVGVRNDLAIAPAHPKPFKFYYTIGEAFKGLTQDDVPPPIGKDTKSYTLYRQTKPGDSFEVAYERLYGRGSMFCHFRLSMDRASNTIKQGTSDIYHPSEPRYLSIAELKRICAFSDDFELTGTFAQKWERIGRAVPPLMMKAIAKTIELEILKKCVE